MKDRKLVHISPSRKRGIEAKCLLEKREKKKTPLVREEGPSRPPSQKSNLEGSYNFKEIVKGHRGVAPPSDFY